VKKQTGSVLDVFNRTEALTEVNKAFTRGTANVATWWPEPAFVTLQQYESAIGTIDNTLVVTYVKGRKITLPGISWTGPDSTLIAVFTGVTNLNDALTNADTIFAKGVPNYAGAIVSTWLGSTLTFRTLTDSRVVTYEAATSILYGTPPLYYQ